MFVILSINHRFICLCNIIIIVVVFLLIFITSVFIRHVTLLCIRINVCWQLFSLEKWELMIQYHQLTGDHYCIAQNWQHMLLKTTLPWLKLSLSGSQGRAASCIHVRWHWTDPVCPAAPLSDTQPSSSAEAQCSGSLWTRSLGTWRVGWSHNTWATESAWCTGVILYIEKARQNQWTQKHLLWFCEGIFVNCFNNVFKENFGCQGVAVMNDGLPVRPIPAVD